MTDVTGESSGAQADAQLLRVRRAFDASHQRMCAAELTGDLEDELSNMLQHLYRIGELANERWGTKDNDTKTKDKELNDRLGEAASGALGAFWIRGYDTHDVTVTAKVVDAYVDPYTAMNGVLIWKPIEKMPFVKHDKAGRWKHYSKSLADADSPPPSPVP